MSCWDRCGDQFIGYFTPRQIRWIREHVRLLRDALQQDHDRSQIKWRIAMALDIADVPDQYRRDIVAGLPSLIGASAWSADLVRVAPDFMQQMVSDTELVLATLPDAGGIVVLPDARHACAWVWSLSDYGRHLAYRLGVDWRPPDGTADPGSETSRKQRSFSKVVSWLTSVVNELIDVADLPSSTVGF